MNLRPPMQLENGMSVVVCCFNSSARLQPTLEHLRAQKNMAMHEWEIIVIDNASTDDSASKATEIWNSFAPGGPSFKVIYEGRPGLSAARKKGIENSRFKFVVFCDDDNWLDENYVSKAFDIMQANPQIGALGGKGSPVFETKEPPHFWKNQYHVLAVGSQWHKEGDITEGRGVLYGAGMVLNKVAYAQLISDFNFEFQVSDRAGDTLVSSGDHELCLALKRIGYKIFYSPGLLFKHFIPQRRTSISYYKNLFRSFGESYTMLLVYFIRKDALESTRLDYRYRCLRYCKNIVQTWLTLVFTGYYFSADRYKYIDRLHFLYTNIGNLKQTLVMKNSFKETFNRTPLFYYSGK